MPEPGQTAYESYVSALDLTPICTWRDLATEMQRVWACVETTCQGKALVQPYYARLPQQEETNHHG